MCDQLCLGKKKSTLLLKLISWDPERWGSVAVNTIIRRLKVHYCRDDNTGNFLLPMAKEEKTEQKTHKFWGLLPSPCLSSSNHMQRGTNVSFWICVKTEIFFTNTILHFKSNHFKVNSSFPLPIVIAITSRKLHLFLKLHLFNFTL